MQTDKMGLEGRSHSAMNSVKAESRIANAMRIMEYNIGEDISISDIADRLNVSTHHFHRDFLSRVGETPASYLRRIRLDTAAQNLRWTEISVGAIAYNLGYQSQASFTRAFTARFGETPNSYRRRFGRTRQPGPKHGASTGVAIRDVERFHLLARRYVGPLDKVRVNWEDFMDKVPAALMRPGRTLYVGRLHDDPLITPPSQIRYDCGITISDEFPGLDDEAARQGLYSTHTFAGRYACLAYCGPNTEIEAGYRAVIQASFGRGQVAGEHPAMEIHSVPRSHQDPEELSFDILLPVY